MNTPRRVYIAGPMTGVPEHNFPAFHAAADRLKRAGWEVVNPAENFGRRTDLPRETYMRADVSSLAGCDAIAMLPRWEEPRGAKLEYLLARELGLSVIDIATLQPIQGAPVPLVQLHRLHIKEEDRVQTTESVLTEALRITASDRQSDYGHPTEDFAKTAKLWTGILAAKLLDGQEVSAMDVPLCMIAVKLARQAHRHKRDNLVDIAGYARTAAMLAGDE